MIVLKVYELDNLSSAIPITLEDDKCYCDHNLNGADTLTFEIQRKNENHISIAEEVKVDVFGNRFVIKKIDEHSDFTTVSCELDLDDWKAKINKNYRAVNELITNVMQNVIPDGWTITYGTGVDTTSRGTVEKQEGKAFIAATSLELLDYISNAFSIVFNFDVLSKTITVINTDAFTSSGEFFMEDLNMTELGYNGDSTNFITRVYAYGKDGLTFADINDGKEYVENVSYSNKIVNYVLIDERYTIKANLLQYAQRVLNEKCQPVKSYTCSIKNFEGSIWLYKVVTIIDQRRQTKVEHQCVKYREYNNHSLDVITLNSQSPSIEKIVSDNMKETNDLIAEQRTYIWEVIQSEIEEATAKITGNQGGYFKWIYDADGLPIELLNLGDTKDINTAQKVWRWNQGGLGHSNNGYNGTYDLALTNDGKINASMITTGILNAGVIRAGIIQDLQGSNFWNLETGAFSLSANATVGGSTVSSIAQTEAEAAVNAQTQLSIFNKLTNNGATQGIYLYNNLLYLNGAYLKANSVSADVIYGGSLTLGGANNVNGSLSVKDANGNTIGSWTNNGISISKGAIHGPNISIGGLDNKDGTLKIYASDNTTLLGSWSVSGIHVYKGEIKGPTIEVGGINNESGSITVKNAYGNVIGTWDKEGLDVKSGTIKGSVITLGGNNNENGRLYVKAANGTDNVISMGQGGIQVYAGIIQGPNIIAGGVNNTNGTIIVKDSNNNNVVVMNNNGAVIKGSITSTKASGSDTLKLIIDDADLKGYENSTLFGHLDLCAQSSDGQPHVSLESKKYLHLESVSTITFDIGGTGATGVEKVVVNSSGLHVTSGNLDVYNNADVGGNLTVDGNSTVSGDLTVSGTLRTNGSNTSVAYMAAGFDAGGNPTGWYAYKVVNGILYDY